MKKQMFSTTAAVCAAFVFLAMPAAAQAPAAIQSPAAPEVFAAGRTGFTPEQAKALKDRYSYRDVISAGDVSFFHFLNVGEMLDTAVIGRSGNSVALESRPDSGITATVVPGVAGGQSLEQYVASGKSGLQGLIVLHQGRIVHESYPGMRPTDKHVWMSVSKTATSLVVRKLVEEGKIDVKRPIDEYIAALKGTAWAGTPVIDVLDMASGMDVIETQANRINPRSIISRYNLAASGEANADGKVESQFDVIRSASRLGPPGQSFDYSSLNTTVLAKLAEAVEQKRWAQIFEERVWGQMTVEGDMQLGIAPDNTPQSHGFLATRLRDMGRYGLLYTPSWHRAAREKLVSDDYVRAIQTGGRKAIFLKGELGNRLTTANFSASPPSANSWQWDAVWDDGDFYKGGVYGQGLYVSPGRDLVVAWFSTVMSTDLTQYARQIAITAAKRK
jgi:CubicO group peptidase (beta-lactamase class C family)